MASSFGRRIAEKLKTAVKDNSFLANGITGCLLCAGSDALAQQLEKGKDASLEIDIATFDRRRFYSAGLIGAFFGGVVYPLAYARLDAMWVGTNFTSVVKKSIVEIGTVGIFVNTISMTARGLLVGRDSREVASHVVSEMPTVTLNDARVWLPYNMIAFSVIPISIRPATTCLMEAMWQTYISLRSNNYSHVEVVSTMPSSSELHSTSALINPVASAVASTN